MNKLMTIMAFGLVISANAYAAGTEVTTSNITNQSVVKNAGALAIAKGIGRVEATQGSILIKNAMVKGSTVINKSQVTNAGALAISLGAGTAISTQGSVKIGD